VSKRAATQEVAAKRFVIFIIERRFEMLRGQSTRVRHVVVVRPVMTTAG
jgi:hypothetical protein